MVGAVGTRPYLAPNTSRLAGTGWAMPTSACSASIIDEPKRGGQDRAGTSLDRKS